MKKLMAAAALILALMPQAIAAPSASQIAKWGIYATLADQEWWLGEDGQLTRYSWIIPGEQLQLETFSADGTRNFNSVIRIENGTFINGTLATAAITSSGSRHMNFGPNNIMELDEELYEYQHRYLFKGEQVVLRYSRTQKPIFPSEDLKARFAGKVSCPPDEAALAKTLASARVKDKRAEDPVVEVGGGIFLGGYAGERRYDSASFQFLEARPTKVIAPISGGKPFGLEAMLPGFDPRKYEPIFRAAFPKGHLYCNEYGCYWRSRKDAWNAHEGALIGASISQVIDSETDLRFLCQYR